MPRIEPSLMPVVSDLARVLRELKVPFVGALVPELLLDVRPRRMTNDADVTVVVESLAEFEALKDRLADYGFTRTGLPHRMRHRDGGVLDMLPFSEAIAPEGRLQLEEGRILNMAGFRHVVPHAVATSVEGGPTLPLAPLPLYVLLKLVAFSDRKAAKDLGGVSRPFHQGQTQASKSVQERVSLINSLVVAELRREGRSATYLRTDVTKLEDVQRLAQRALDEYGRLDVFVNNAGIMPLSTLDQLKIDEWNQMIDVNIRGVLHGIASALPHFKKEKSGQFVNVSSLGGRIAVATGAVYCGTKFAVHAISEALRQEVGATFASRSSHRASSNPTSPRRSRIPRRRSS
jgi:hypothetical protein